MAAKKKTEFAPLDAKSAAWVSEHARPAESPCLCGCGGTTKGRFVPGHDAVLKERLRATIGARGEEAGTEEAQVAAKAALAKFGW